MKDGTILGARRFLEKRGARRCSDLLDSGPARRRPRLLRGGGAPGGGARAHRACHGGREGPQGKSRTDSLASNDFAHFSLSFQSSFHLSLTVLVRYRSPANIQLSMDITTGLALQSQATRLTGGRPGVGRFGRDGALTLSGSLSQQRIAPDARGAACPGYNAARERARAAFHIELVPLHSPLLRESWLVSFPPLINMFKFSGSSCSSSALV